MPRTSAARRKDEPPRTYRVKVTLMETDPPIWRRLIVPGDTTLARLDRIVQAAMGWTNSHLHMFTVGGVLYTEPSPEWEVEGLGRVHDGRSLRPRRFRPRRGKQGDRGASLPPSPRLARAQRIGPPLSSRGATLRAEEEKRQRGRRRVARRE
jgi:hypothetical protein